MSEMTAPVFDLGFRAELDRLLAWRRDVRRFRTAPVPAELIAHLVELAHLSPSVGNSQPWRWVSVESQGARALVRANFERSNVDALAAQREDRRGLYASLKLAGLDRAPVQFAVFSDSDTEQGYRLGRLSMPETLDYSTVGSIMSFWLAARAAGLGVGWVSILDPARLSEDFSMPASYKLIAYLCVGWPEEEHLDPELARCGWQERMPVGQCLLRR